MPVYVVALVSAVVAFVFALAAGNISGCIGWGIAAFAIGHCIDLRRHICRLEKGMPK